MSSQDNEDNENISEQYHKVNNKECSECIISCTLWKYIVSVIASL